MASASTDLPPDLPSASQEPCMPDANVGVEECVLPTAPGEASLGELKRMASEDLENPDPAKRAMLMEYAAAMQVPSPEPLNSFLNGHSDSQQDRQACDTLESLRLAAVALKACNLCSKMLPVGTFHTYADGKVRPYCCACDRLQKRGHRRGLKVERVRELMAQGSLHILGQTRECSAEKLTHKKCNLCGNRHPLEEFHKFHDGKVRAYCRTCDKLQKKGRRRGLTVEQMRQLLANNSLDAVMSTKVAVFTKNAPPKVPKNRGAAAAGEHGGLYDVGNGLPQGDMGDAGAHGAYDAPPPVGCSHENFVQAQEAMLRATLGAGMAPARPGAFCALLGVSPLLWEDPSAGGALGEMPSGLNPAHAFPMPPPHHSNPLSDLLANYDPKALDAPPHLPGSMDAVHGYPQLNFPPPAAMPSGLDTLAHVAYPHIAGMPQDPSASLPPPQINAALVAAASASFDALANPASAPPGVPNLSAPPPLPLVPPAPWSLDPRGQLTHGLPPNGAALPQYSAPQAFQPPPVPAPVATDPPALQPPLLPEAGVAALDGGAPAPQGLPLQPPPADLAIPPTAPDPVPAAGSETLAPSTASLFVTGGAPMAMPLPEGDVAVAAEPPVGPPSLPVAFEAAVPAVATSQPAEAVATE